MSGWKVFGDRVRDLLEEHGMSQRELAEKAGVTEVSISRYVNGNRIPHGPNIAKIANVLGVTCDFLMGTSENRNGIKVQKEPKFGEWTFCNDQMPKDGQIVILKHKFRSDVYGNVTIGQYKRGRFVWYGYQSDWDNHTSIVANGDREPGNEYVEKWMPLPE